jgi:capsular polysaccharide biosynthesis protein
VDLEAIVRAIWRRRGRVVLCVVAFAVAVPVLFGFAFAPQYASATELEVYPVPDSTGAIPVTYNLQPNRYVATQIALLSSRASMAEVAEQLHLNVNDVSNMVVVDQISKSDALRVTATSTDAKRAAAVSSRLVENYVNTINSESTKQYAAAAKTLQSQNASLTTQVSAVADQIKAAGQQVGDVGALQSQYASLISQQQILQSKLLNIQTMQSNQGGDNSTHVVSNSGVSTVATGSSKKTLAMYGAAFGLGLAVLVISVGTMPGRSLEELDLVEEIEGVEVLGVLEPKKRTDRTDGMQNVHGLRIGSEMRTIIKQKGQITLVPVGRHDRMVRASDVLVRLVAGRKVDPDEFDEVGVLRTDSFAAFMELPEPENQRVILAVDVEKVSRRDLVDTLVTLDSLGTEVMGLVGIR